MKLAELSADEQEEANERQLAELEFVQSAYSTEEAWISKNDGCRSVVRLLQLPVVLSGNTSHDSVVIHLHLKLPAAYPIRHDAHLVVSASLESSPANPSLIRKAALNAITSLVTTCQSAACDYAQYGESIWHVFHVAEEWIDNEWPNMLLQQQVTQSMKSIDTTPASSSPTSRRIGRRAIYSHHIIANSKRKDLASLAHNYKLGGYVKIGWPGIILFEGDETSVQTVVDEIKTWRWQHLSIRVEESFDVNNGTIDMYRKLPKTFVELGENDMSLLAQYCREAGLEHMFLQCLKIDNGTTQSSTTSSSIHNDENDETKQASNNTNMTYAALVHVDHMNDRKNYEKWLKKESESVGCTLFIRHVTTSRLSNSNSNWTMIYVGLIGSKEGVKKVLKQWRICKVDVDSKNKPCLERMMSVMKEGEIQNLSRDALKRLEILVSLGTMNDGHCYSLEEFCKDLSIIFGDGWGEAITE